MTDTVRVTKLTPTQRWRCEEAVRTFEDRTVAEAIQWGSTWLEGSREHVALLLDCLRRTPAEIDEDPYNYVALMDGDDLSWEQVQKRVKQAKASCAAATKRVEAALAGVCSGA